MIKNLITVFLSLDHYVDPNLLLASLSNIGGQELDPKVSVEIVLVDTHQTHPKVQELYADVEGLKARFGEWPDQFQIKYFLSDDNSFMKVRNYTDNEVSGNIGELVAFKSVAPLVWYPNHLQAH